MPAPPPTPHPALLAYDASLTLISTRGGTRTIPYRDFHLSYKRLPSLQTSSYIASPFHANLNGYKTYIRKVGTRNAQAISKVAIAAIARMSNGLIDDIRIGGASLLEDADSALRPPNNPSSISQSHPKQ